MHGYDYCGKYSNKHFISIDDDCTLIVDLFGHPQIQIFNIPKSAIDLMKASDTVFFN